MQGKKYRRPLLCRLCECPAVDGGVLLRKPLYMDKLRRWWKAHWDIDLQQKRCTVCYFCIWDLRFSNQHSEEKEPADQMWWPKTETHRNAHRNNDKYYNDEWMKPCSVKITPLNNEDNLLKAYEQKGLGHRHRCLFCPLNYSIHQNLVIHTKKAHPDHFFYCCKTNCGKLFHTKEEKADHTEKEHQGTKEPLKCVYCGKLSTNKSNHKVHLLKQHRKQIIICPKFNCRETFKTAEVRDKHVEDVHNCGKYFCCFCNRYFKCQKSLWSHMKGHKGALKCNAIRGCPNYFKTKEDRQKHVQENHDANKFKCIFCNFSYPHRLSLTAHIRWYHKDEALRCEYNNQCSTWFKSEEEREKHYKDDHESGDDKVVCPFCKKKLLKKDWAIGVHFRIHHKKEKVFMCDYAYLCPNYFKSEEDKLKHIKEVHKNLDEKFRCVYCEKFIPKYMSYHVKQWHRDVAIKCNFQERCATYFKTLEDRDKHIKEVHQAEKIREAAPCLYCDKILGGKNTLSSHISLKHPKIAIKCLFPHCGTFFKNQEDLENHFALKPKHNQFETKKSHVKIFKCALCSKAFPYKSGVKKHMKVAHAMEDVCPHCQKPCSKKRNHVISDFCKVCNQKFLCLGLFRSHTKKCRSVFHCPVCSKSFKLQSELNYHCKRNHTVPILKWRGLENQSKGFKCDDCLTYFSSKNILQAHTRLLHRSTIFTCDFCQKKCSNKMSLIKHLSRQHLGLTKFVHCPVCNLKMDKNKCRQRKHAATHFNQNKVSCEICAKIMTPIGLKNHMIMMH